MDPANRFIEGNIAAGPSAEQFVRPASQAGV